MYLFETKIFKSIEIILKVITTNNSQSHFMLVFNIFLFQLCLNHYLIKIYKAKRKATSSHVLLRSTSQEYWWRRKRCQWWLGSTPFVRSMQTDHLLGIISSYKVTAVLVVEWQRMRCFHCQYLSCLMFEPHLARAFWKMKNIAYYFSIAFHLFF